ncbi:MAG: prolipoprotein diacylglyceryl transferase [Mycobacterium sp.]
MTLNWLTYFPSPARGVWHLGPIPIRAYALCIIVGIISALLIGDRRWRARGGEPGVIYDIALWAVPFGLVGGRLYHLMTDWRTYFGEGGVGWAATPRIWDGGLGIWGAVALGGVGAWIGCRQRGIPLPAFGDAVAPGIVLAQAIGRIGNYFNQELYGRETTLPWGMEVFWREDAAGLRDPHLLDGVSTGELYKIVQPTFLYELVWNVLIFALLIYADRLFRMGHGRLFALYVAGYCIGRFGIELLRDDTATHIAGIRVNSFTSTFVFIGAVVYILLATKGREDPEVLRRGWQRDEVEVPSPEETVLEPEKELAEVGAASGAVARVALSKDVAARFGAEVTEPDETAEAELVVIEADAGGDEIAEPAEAEELTVEDPGAEAPEGSDETPSAEPADQAEESEDQADTEEPGEPEEPAESEEPTVEDPGAEAPEVSDETPPEEPADQADEPADQAEPEEPAEREPEAEEPAGTESATATVDAVTDEALEASDDTGTGSN